MNLKIKAAVFGLFTATVSMILYFSFRIDFMERDHIAAVRTENRVVVKELTRIGENQGESGEDFTGYLREVTERHDRVALIAVADKERKLLAASRNSSHIPTSRVFDSILADFTGHSLQLTNDREYISRYYYDSDGPDKREIKYYLFPGSFGEKTYLTAYPYRPGPRIITRAALEIALILILNGVIALLIYITAGRGGEERQAPPEEIMPEEEHPRPIEIDTAAAPVSSGDRSEEGLATSTVSDSLSRSVRDLFLSLKKEFGADTMTLFVKQDDESLGKRFELKGNSFLAIDSSTFEAIGLDTDMGKELTRAVPFIADGGRHAIIPLIHRDILVGTLSIRRESDFTGAEVTSIREMAASIARPVSDLAVLTSVLNDEGTGIYSKTYFEMKFRENLTVHERRGTPFTVMLAILTGDTGGLSAPEINVMIRTVAKAMKDRLDRDAVICRYDSMIGVIMPDTPEERAGDAAAAIHGTLSRWNIKLGGGRMVVLSPKIAIASTDEGDPASLIETALERLRE